ncbi:MAG: lytic transglycosylase domain-containing protein [Aquificota bacterium]|nr:lytic transglycosylase domain-containing protein [Aquificota bacterium]
MVLLLTVLLPAVCFGKPPLEYVLLKEYLKSRDVYTAYFLLDNFRDAVFTDELRVELAWDLVRTGKEEEARRVIGEADLFRVRDVYADKVVEIWRSLRLDPKPLVLRFPEKVPQLIGKVDLSDGERERILKRLIREGKYEDVLRLSGSLCFYRTLALYRLGRFRQAVRTGDRCEDRRAWRYALLSLIRTSETKAAKRFVLKKDDPDLYFLLGWEFLQKGDLKNARRYISRSGENFRRYFYLAVIRYMEGRYRIAYEILSEAERFAVRSTQRSRVYFWKFKILNAMGDRVMAYYYLGKASEEEGFYGAVARRLMGVRVFRRPVIRVAGPSDPSTVARLTGIAEAGFPYYLRLELMRLADGMSPWDLLTLSRLDPGAVIRIVARRFGAGSDVYRAVAFPTPFREIVRRASERFGIGEDLIYAVMRQESLFDPFALSRSGAKGLMQVIDSTARWVGERFGIEHRNLFDPEVNITIGTAYLRHLIDLWEGDLIRALASYNAGPGAVSGWRRFEDDFLYIELIPYRETRRYVKRVLWYYYVYREVLSKEGP